MNLNTLLFVSLCFFITATNSCMKFSENEKAVLRERMTTMRNELEQTNDQDVSECSIIKTIATTHMDPTVDISTVGIPGQPQQSNPPAQKISECLLALPGPISVREIQRDEEPEYIRSLLCFYRSKNKKNTPKPKCVCNDREDVCIALMNDITIIPCCALCFLPMAPMCFDLCSDQQTREDIITKQICCCACYDISCSRANYE
jgi:hypothetical protein